MSTMPISIDFYGRLTRLLPEIVERFGSPFHIYDESGIINSGRHLLNLFKDIPGFREYFAIKALPNLRILEILRKELGFGFDCSSIVELQMARRVGAIDEDIMFSSNNTSRTEYEVATSFGGSILNLDDVSFIDKLPIVPKLMSFRYNPGININGNDVIGSPIESKFGLRRDQLEAAYVRARERGAERFGLHMMIATNQLDWRRVRDGVIMLLNVSTALKESVGIELEFVNMGGGIGIPYRPCEKAFDFEAFSGWATDYFIKYGDSQREASIKLFMECGRAITGPHGVMIAKVINVMSKHREFIGVDASMNALMRPSMYSYAYNHITALDRHGQQKTGSSSVVDVVGSICENNDKFSQQIRLPKVKEGDLLLFHDTGAHGHAMGFQYNGRLRPQELLLRRNNDVELIRRAETIDDYLATQLQL